MKRILILVFLLHAGALLADMKILALSGSTREASLNKKLLAEAIELVQNRGATVTVFDLKKYPLPFYDGDVELNEGMPENAKKLRRLMIESDLILIASPEYNGSLSAVLKNAIDWASRSEQGTSSREAFAGKHFFIMSASPGNGGGVRGLAHLRTILSNVGGEVHPEQLTLPQAYERLGKSEDPYHKELVDLIDISIPVAK